MRKLNLGLQWGPNCCVVTALTRSYEVECKWYCYGPVRSHRISKRVLLAWAGKDPSGEDALGEQSVPTFLCSVCCQEVWCGLMPPVPRDTETRSACRCAQRSSVLGAWYQGRFAVDRDNLQKSSVGEIDQGIWCLEGRLTHYRAICYLIIQEVS